MKKILILLLIVSLIACEENINNWQLISGEPPYADPVPIIYKGTAVLEGKIIYKPAYVGEEVPHFRVKNTEKLPYQINDFEISAKPEIMEEIYKLERAKVLATDIIVNMEGSPILKVKEILGEPD